jgi:putative oxidoreductase
MGSTVQRLFSNFANGWPGVGLLLLRLLTGTILIRFGIDHVGGVPQLLMVTLQMIGVAAALLLVLGLLTPVAGTLAALAKLWIAVARFSSYSSDPWTPLAQAILAGALAMIGPGAWSIDARLFGRKHIDPSDF